MLPRDTDVRNLALYAPKIALGMVLGIPRIPFVRSITRQANQPSPIVPIEFDVNYVTPPTPAQNNIGTNAIISGTLGNNVDRDTLIERITYSLWQPNAFSAPASPFQTLYLSMLRESTGVDVQIDVYGPKYRVCEFTPLENVADILAITWPNGWPLRRQSNVQVQAVLTRAQPGTTMSPVGIPYIVNMALVGWQFAGGSEIDSMTDDDARARLNALGIQTPKV